MRRFSHKIGFIGMGNMSQAIVRGLIESGTAEPHQIFASNRSPGKLQKAVDNWGIHAMPGNEEVVDAADVIILGMKPQDFDVAVEPIASAFRPQQIVISLAAGIEMHSLRKKLAEPRLVRVAANTPAVIRKGVLGYLMEKDDAGLETVVEDLFSPLGALIECVDEDQFEALIISCSSGTGFVFELMSYFQDWIEERGFEPDVARTMTVETFLGASMLAATQKAVTVEDLQAKVVSKKGVTAAGLESMRELELERALRISFEKAAIRNRELGKGT